MTSTAKGFLIGIGMFLFIFLLTVPPYLLIEKAPMWADLYWLGTAGIGWIVYRVATRYYENRNG